MPALSPPPPLRADAARNRARVLEVAREQLSAGDLTLAMNVIARQAGVGVGTVYRHFPTRQVLLEHLAMDSLEHLLTEAQAAAEQDDAAQGLADLLRSGLRCLLDDIGLVAVLQSPEAVCVQTSQLRRDLFTALARLLDRARSAGAIRPEVGADDLRRHLCGLAHAVRLGAADPATVERDLEVLLAGLRPTRSG